MSRMVRVVVLLILALLPGMESRAQEVEAGAPSLLFIFDASGSMWGQIEGENKIVIARRVFGDLVGELPVDSRAGLIAYGHRREGDCDDIETLVPIGPLDGASLVGMVNDINPKGKTPITKSIKQAFDVVRDSAEASSIILVSDGLETCGGDPCAAVRLAKEQGLQFVMHVIGFDVADEDVSQLECAAQAGGGMFTSAENAGELSAALEAAVAMPADVPPGRLSVKSVADGELHDAVIHVTDRETGERVADSRTYFSADTNPRLVPLPDGTFDVIVRAQGIKGDVSREFELVIAGGELVEKEFDFSTGEIVIGVTRNGERSDAAFRIYVAGTREEVDAGRTYTGANSNPATTRLTAGRYDVEIGSVEIEGAPVRALGAVTLEPGDRQELSHDYSSGILRVGAAVGDELVDAVVHVLDSTTGREVAKSRTYTGERSNPSTFILEPGDYRVEVKTLRVEGKPDAAFEVTVSRGETVERLSNFGEAKKGTGT